MIKRSLTGAGVEKVAEKSKQHFVPRVYLKAFCDPTPPPDWPAEKPFQPALWLIHKSLEQPPRRRAPSSVLWANRAYNLRDDDPSRPVLEDQLSEIENEYARVLPKLIAHSELTDRDWITLLVFVGTLRSRSLDHLAFQQEQIDAIERLYRQVERASTGEERHADQFWAGADEGAKRVALREAGIYARLMNEAGAWLIVNESEYPFITSDNPVVHEFVHIDELMALGFPPDLWRPGTLPNEKAFFSYCALTPRVGFVSSPLLCPPPDQYWSSGWPWLPGALNLLTRRRALEFIVSRTPQPFGPSQQRLLDYEAQKRSLTPDPRPILEVYTDRSRYQMRLESYEHEAEVFNSRLRFVTRDLKQLHRLAAANAIQEITLRDGKKGIHMRDLLLLSVALAPNTESVMAQDLGGNLRRSAQEN